MEGAAGNGVSNDMILGGGDRVLPKGKSKGKIFNTEGAEVTLKNAR
jgi:hypothetical protein